MKYILSAIILTCFFSCTKKLDPGFKTFLDSFENISLPVKIKGCNVDYSNYKELNDSISLKIIQDKEYAIGKFSPNNNYVATITLGMADCMLPVLTTYDFHGKQISKETIAIGYCGSGPCFQCEEYMEISKDLKLYTSDTITTFDCDSNDNNIPGSKKIEIIYKEGKVDKNGKFKLTGEIKKNL